VCAVTQRGTAFFFCSFLFLSISPAGCLFFPPCAAVLFSILVGGEKGKSANTHTRILMCTLHLQIYLVLTFSFCGDAVTVARCEGSSHEAVCSLFFLLFTNTVGQSPAFTQWCVKHSSPSSPPSLSTAMNGRNTH
jgi:hypothetical protein